MKFILKWFSKEKLYEEILQREFPDMSARVENVSIWADTYHRVPILRDWLKRREITLLKSSTLSDKSRVFLLGQIAENRLYQSFDVPPKGGVEEEHIKPKEVKIPKSKEELLKQWNGDRGVAESGAGK